MSHTTKIGNTVFIHNGDYSGEVEIIRGNKQLWVPTKDLAGFVAEWIRSSKIESLEGASVEELLGVEVDNEEPEGD